MQRFVLILLALMVAASASFGASASWRCANCNQCVFTPGIGFHCPGVVPGAGMHTTAGSAKKQGFCSHCQGSTASSANKQTALSSLVASICGHCQCRFTMTGMHAPATMAHAHSGGALLSAMMGQPAILLSTPTPTIGFIVRPIVFTTGPPRPITSCPQSVSSSRAPPRLLPA